MAYFKIEFWAILLNVIGLCLWAITLFCIIKNKLKYSQRTVMERSVKDSGTFDDEVLIQIVKQQSDNAFETISHAIQKERACLHRLIETGKHEQGGNYLFAGGPDEPDAFLPRNGQINPGGDATMRNRYDEVAKLADLGMSTEKIAKKVKIPKGEIDLIIKLKNRANGSSSKIQGGGQGLFALPGSEKMPLFGGGIPGLIGKNGIAGQEIPMQNIIQD